MLWVAIVRLIGAHSGLSGAVVMLGGVEHGRARKDTRDANGALTRARTDFVCATIQDGPFVEIDAPD